MLTVLHIIWALITLAILGFGVYGLVIKVPILAVSCFALVAISSVFVVNDVKMLFAKKNVPPTNKK